VSKLRLCVGVAVLVAGCHAKQAPAPGARPAAVPAPAKPTRPVIPARAPVAPAPEGQVLAYDAGVAKPMPIDDARAAGLLVVDLTDDWAPYILQDGDGAEAKPNAYRKTFVELPNDRVDADGLALRSGDHNYLEVFGIPPTLSVLAARAEADVAPAREACYDAVDREGFEQYTGEVGYLDRDRSRRDFEQAARDTEWLEKELAERADGGATSEAALAALREDPKARGRVDRQARGKSRVRAIKAAQARLLCEGLLTPRTKYTPGMFDLPTHEALATWERKNDVFGWGFLGGETLGLLQSPTRGLLLEAFKRFLAERVADAAGIVEDGSINQARKRNPPTWKDSAGKPQPIPNLIGDHVDALLAAIAVKTPEDMIAFMRAHKDDLGKLRVAFKAPPLPEYYSNGNPQGVPVTPPAKSSGGQSPPPLTRSPDERAEEMDIFAEIDRGDVWYDLPFNDKGKPVVQRRDHFPHLTVFVRWRGQKIPLAWWRTTIGSWRSEMHADGQVYFKYKNSDVGPRVWRQIVAAPVWIPPDSTPAKDLLTRKVLDRNVGPVTVVNTDVMGPGFQSAYGIVMGIHVDPKRGNFDNQIRTHGSVDYTSIARRFSHGCHRLVNNRAVRLFGFVLRHRAFKRIGDVPMNLKKRFEVDEEVYKYAIKTRGYYYELLNPVPVIVSEGKIMGEVKKPITAYVRKPGVEYVTDPASGDAAASTAVVGTESAP
jgi:hypothetical protein